MSVTGIGVTGIGGLFFRARDPEALAAWYHQYLGIGPNTEGDGYEPWAQQAGPTVFMPFPADTDYWPAERQWMLNLRVADLDALIAKLQADGIAVATNPEWDSPEMGRFARIHDPEGHALELWQPPE
ncbi:VOC family protein [Novosphingobium sp. 9]|uniref:VOC family protein n=1 Tax=Novosphingobium sp. 9 TaxID=2025349 RepID=UPI0021B5CC9F|nr:VOC family protein [Novosphingobium sp. 9]